MTWKKSKKILVELQYKRNDQVHTRGTFRIRGDPTEIFPSHLEDRSWRISFLVKQLSQSMSLILFFRNVSKTLDEISIFANSHYVTPKSSLNKAIDQIQEELETRMKYFEEKKIIFRSTEN